MTIASTSRIKLSNDDPVHKEGTVSAEPHSATGSATTVHG